MAELYAYDKNSQLAISGSTIWDYAQPANPVSIGATDADGRFVSDDLLPRRMRVIAGGYIPIDRVTGSQQTATLRFTKLHPGAYSGYLPSAGIATWSRENGDDVMQFTSTGLFRRSDDPITLDSVEFVQYRMLESLNWASLGTRTNLFPTTFLGGWTQIIDYNGFRFPAPGIMLGRSHRDLSVVRYVRIN